MNIVSFLSDFGPGHGYVGSVKGIILTYNPAAAIIDISHQVESFNIREMHQKYFHAKLVAIKLQ